MPPGISRIAIYAHDGRRKAGPSGTVRTGSPLPNTRHRSRGLRPSCAQCESLAPPPAVLNVLESSSPVE